MATRRRGTGGRRVGRTQRRMRAQRDARNAFERAAVLVVGSSRIGYLAASSSLMSMPRPGFSLLQSMPSFISGQPGKTSFKASLKPPNSCMPKLFFAISSIPFASSPIGAVSPGAERRRGSLPAIPRRSPSASTRSRSALSSASVGGSVAGALIANTLTESGGSGLHYDEALGAGRSVAGT